MKLKVHAVIHAVAAVEVDVQLDGLTMVTVPSDFHLATPCSMEVPKSLACDAEFIEYVRAVTTKQLADYVATRIGHDVEQHAQRQLVPDGAEA